MKIARPEVGIDQTFQLLCRLSAVRLLNLLLGFLLPAPAIFSFLPDGIALYYVNRGPSSVNQHPVFMHTVIP